MGVPQELLLAYAEIIKNESDTRNAAGHLVNFLIDAQRIAAVIAEAVENARQRATPPAQQQQAQ